MNWQYIRLWSSHYCKKVLFNIIDRLISVYEKLIIIYCRLSPGFVQRRLFFNFLSLLNGMGLQYLYFRSLAKSDLKLLQKSLTISSLHSKNFAFSLEEKHTPNSHHDLNNRKTFTRNLSLVTLFLLNGQNERAFKILQQINSTKSAFLLKMAKKYFDFGRFAESELILNRYSYVKVLQIENPYQGKNTDWYKSLKISPAKEYNFHLPAVFPTRLNNSPSKTVIVPAEEIFHIKNAEIYCGNVVVAGNRKLFLYEPGSHPSFESVAGNWHHLYSSHLQINYCLLFTNYKYEREVETAILIDGRSSNNYFHWIIEYLPRLYTIQKDPDIAKLPLIVDESMLPTCKEALRVVFPHANIIWNNKRTKLKVKNLYIPSFHTFHPDHMQLPFWKICGLSTDHLAFIRDAAYNQANIVAKPSRKIYLKRSSNLRGLINLAEIEQVLQQANFETIDPATLSFIEQVELFSSAKYIVGIGGAAFTNLMFCQPGCVVVGLVSKQLEDFCMQSNIASFAGCKFVYLSGIHDISLKNWLSLPNHIHANFAINPRKLNAALLHFNLN